MEVLGTLTRALRTEVNVELAVLYGSVARGDDGPGSDVDVLVAFRDDARGAATALGGRLTRRLGRRVDIACLARARERAPFLLLQALDEGRVLVDRSDAWSALVGGREAVARAARRQQQQLRRDAAASVDGLLAFDWLRDHDVDVL